MASAPLRTSGRQPFGGGAYIGSVLQLFVGGTVIVWLPSYLNRYYAMATGAAGGVAALIVFSSGIGMILAACSATACVGIRRKANSAWRSLSPAVRVAAAPSPCRTARRNWC